jgi:hypothetical protein
MLRLTLELSGASMRRTPTVAVEATGACASLLTGLLPPVLEAHAADDALHGGQFGRRQCIGHGRNIPGQPAVCRRSPRNGASRRHPPFSTISTPLSTASLLCCFSAAVCVQVVTGAFGPAPMLSPPVAETRAKSGACARALFALAGLFRRFQTRLAQAGVRVQIWRVCYWCVRGSAVLGVQRG